MSHTLQRHSVVLIAIAFSLMFLATLCQATPAEADGIFIPAPERKDGAFGLDNRIMYITNGDRVLRYDLTTQSFLEPFVLGGQLMGIDLSPDGKTLAVADHSYSTDQVWFHVIHLDGETSEVVPFSRSDGEEGTFAVAFGNDGRVYVSSDSRTTYWPPFRSYDSVSDTATVIGVLGNRATLGPSCDRTVIAYAEPSFSTGPWGRYYVSSGELAPSPDSGSFNYEVATNHDASQFTLLTSSGAFIYDANPSQIASLGAYATSRPIGAVYHTSQDLLYTAWYGTTAVRVYETSEFQQVDAFNMGDLFESNHNHAFTNGHMRISADGSLLLVTVSEGVRVLRTSAHHTGTNLEANAVQVPSGNPTLLSAVVRRITGDNETPSGTVAFYRRQPGGQLAKLTSGSLDDTGSTSVAVTLPIGTHSIMAEYLGNLVDRNSTSSTVVIEVSRIPTITTLEVSPDQPVHGQDLIIIPTVSQVITGALMAPTGTVEIWDGTVLLGQVPSSTPWPTVITVPALSVGSHCLTATYKGDSNNASSTSSPTCVTVERAQVMMLVGRQVTHSEGGYGAAITATLRAVPPGSGVPTGNLKFYLGALAVGTSSLDSEASTTFYLLGLSDEIHLLRADYSGDDHFRPTSGSVPIGPWQQQYLSFLSSASAAW